MLTYAAAWQERRLRRFVRELPRMLTHALLALGLLIAGAEEEYTLRLELALLET